MTFFAKDLWPSVLAAFLISAAASRLLAYLYVKKGWCAPSRTGGAMPLTGGIGILAGFVSCLLIFWICHRFDQLIDISFFLFSIIVLGLLLPFFVLGLLDDFVHFRPLPKLLLFILAAALQLILIFSCLIVLSFSGYSFPPSSFLLPLLVVFLLFFFANSYNFLDNANGHCAVAVLGTVLAAFFTSGTEINEAEIAIFHLGLAASVVGFLIWNFPFKPKLYLGDAGSLFLGALTVLMVALSRPGESHVVLECATLLAFPLYDTCAVMLLRVLRGQNPTIGGQDHYSHRLLRGGFPLWLVNLIAFTAAGVLPVIVLKLPSQTVFFGPFVIWAFLLFLDVLAALLAKMARNSSEAD